MFMKLLDKCNELGILAKDDFYINVGWGEIQVEDHRDGEFSMTMPLYYFATGFLNVVPLMSKCDKRLSVFDGYSIDLPENFDDPNVAEIMITRYDETNELRIASLTLDKCVIFDQCAVKLFNHFEPIDNEEDDNGDENDETANDVSTKKITLTNDEDDGSNVIESSQYAVQCIKLVTIYVLRKDTIKSQFNISGTGGNKKGKPKK